VIVDPGAYYFRSLQYAGSHVAWDGLRNLIIDLQGSDLYFSFPLVSGITITNSMNLVLQNFTADHDPLPFTQVRVISVDAAQRRIRFAVDGTWQNPSLLNAVFDAPKTSFQGIEVHMFRKRPSSRRCATHERRRPRWERSIHELRQIRPATLRARSSRKSGPETSPFWVCALDPVR
jgi:hypothetical protein